MDSHFLYTLKTNAVSMEDNDVDGDDDEDYGEMGSVDHIDKYD